MESSVSSWLLILILLCITTIYVLVEPVLTDQRRKAKNNKQETSDKTSKVIVQTNIEEETEQAHDTNDRGIHQINLA